MIENVLLNPNWFWDHKYTPIVSYLKNKEFIIECQNFRDDANNSVLHYLFINCKKFDNMTLLLMKWLIHNGLSMNQSNKKGMTPFYYYMNFIFENNLDENTEFDKYFMQVVDFHDKESVHSNGNNFIHLLCFCPFVYKHKIVIKDLIIENVEKLSKKNNSKQIPLYIAMSYWRDTHNLPLLYFMFQKTPYECLSSCDTMGRNCFHLACEYNLIHIINFMILKDKNIVHTRMLTEKKNPICFTIIKNADIVLIRHLLQKSPELFTQKNVDDKNALDILFESYITTKENDVYKKIFALLIKNKHVNDKLTNIKDIYNKMKLFDQHKEYDCLICLQEKDIREWEIPVCCANHQEKMHKSCFDKWYKISKSCPVCDYKKEVFVEQPGFKFEIETCSICPLE